MSPAQKAVQALRAPNYTFARTPNTVRQSVADIIEDQMALLKRARQFVADAGSDEDDHDVNIERNILLREIDAAISIESGISHE